MHIGCKHDHSEAQPAGGGQPHAHDHKEHVHQDQDHDHDHDHGGHDHHHGHGHGHHHHIPKNFDRSFAIGAFLNFAFVGAELYFGYAAKSLALMADAVHNFSDVVGLLLAWGAAWLGRLSPSGDRTYGYRGASILAALGNAGLLFLATGGIIIESIRRFGSPTPVASGTMLWVACLGIAINFGTAMLFWRGQKDDINLRGAFMHMIGDAAISFGVVLAALIIRAKGWEWLDPAISLTIATIVVIASWDLAKEATHLALAGVPRNVDKAAVEKYLTSLPGVTELHDLHIWAMSTTETALTAHLLRPGSSVDDKFLQDVCAELQRNFKIHHATIQIEAGNAENCRLAPQEVV